MVNEEFINEERKNKTVQMKKILDSIQNIYINKNLQNEAIYILDEYKKFLNKVDSLTKESLKVFLAAIKEEEMLMTQLSEQQNHLLIVDSMVDDDVRKDSIDYIINKVIKLKPLTRANLKFAHKILLDGSIDKIKISEEELNKLIQFRGSETLWVGTWKNGQPLIHYFPPKEKEIQESLDEILKFMNNEEYANSELDLFIQPIIVHALIAILQPFYDGNSRLCRLLQNAYFLRNTNNVYDKKYHSLLITSAKGYNDFKENYRTSIGKLAVDPSPENWHKWILFNLHTIETSITYMEERYLNNLETYGLNNSESKKYY